MQHIQIKLFAETLAAVRLHDASWTAHGSGGTGPRGRYAEPENEAARQLEAQAGT